MQTQSIYINPIDLLKRAPKERIGAMASELRMCEQLQVMGWFASNGQQLEPRARYLEGEIARLERLLKKKGQYY